ncbi:MAG: VTT domain-containing protein [Microthrixaceae bacterium]
MSTPRIAALAAAVVAATLFVAFGGLGWVLEDGNVEELLTETGALGPAIFIGIMWVTQPFGVPGFVYMVPAGIVWPFPLAVAVSWVGNMGSSYLGFSFARWFARDWVSERIPPRMHVFDQRLAEGGLMPVIALRLVFGQLPPADWLLGVTKISRARFLVGTAIGIVPGAVIAVVAGGGLVRLLFDLPPTARLMAIGAVAVAIPVGVYWWRTRRPGTSAGVEALPNGDEPRVIG